MFYVCILRVPYIMCIRSKEERMAMHIIVIVRDPIERKKFMKDDKYQMAERAADIALSQYDKSSETKR